MKITDKHGQQWQLVPLDPTESIERAYYWQQEKSGFLNCYPVYKAMLSAAPEPDLPEGLEPVAWSYTSKITGAETLTHQPPDRVIEHEQFVIHPLYLAPQPTPQEVDDARRYRFLRDHKFKHNGHCLALVGPILWEETLDAAIDAAIAKEES